LKNYVIYRLIQIFFANQDYPQEEISTFQKLGHFYFVLTKQDYPLTNLSQIGKINKLNHQLYMWKEIQSVRNDLTNSVLNLVRRMRSV